MSYGAFLTTPDQAVDQGVARWAGKSLEENVKQPQVVAILDRARAERLGFLLVALGFLFQIPSALPGRVRREQG